MTNDNELIRRGDVMAAIQGYAVQQVGKFQHPTLRGAAEAIAAIPAVAASQPANLETCGRCMGSGYGGHPDSGAVRTDCNGDGAVAASQPADPVIKADSCQRVTVKPLVFDDLGIASDDLLNQTIVYSKKEDQDRHNATRAARILASIDTQPDPQCCMCGKLGLSTAEDGGPERELHDGRWVCSSECWNNASSLAEPTPPQPDPRDAVIARLVEALTDVHKKAICLRGDQAYREFARYAEKKTRAAIAAAKGGAA